MFNLRPHDIRLTVNPEIYPELSEKLNMVKRKSRGDLLLRLAHDALMGNFNTQLVHANPLKSVESNNHPDYVDADYDPEKPIKVGELSADFSHNAFGDFT